MMIIIAHTCFSEGDKTSRFWLNFRFRFVVFRVGGQTTCKNFSGGFFNGHRMWTPPFSLFVFRFLWKKSCSRWRHPSHVISFGVVFIHVVVVPRRVKVCPPKVLISSEQFSLFSCLFCLKKPSKFVSLSGFDLVGSFLDYYDVVSGPPEMTIERLFFIVCVKLLSLSSYF
jgi:hypothetical protein